MENPDSKLLATILKIARAKRPLRSRGIPVENLPDLGSECTEADSTAMNESYAIQSSSATPPAQPLKHAYYYSCKPGPSPVGLVRICHFDTGAPKLSPGSLARVSVRATRR